MFKVHVAGHVAVSLHCLDERSGFNLFCQPSNCSPGLVNRISLPRMIFYPRKPEITDKSLSKVAEFSFPVSSDLWSHTSRRMGFRDSHKFLQLRSLKAKVLEFMCRDVCRQLLTYWIRSQLSLCFTNHYIFGQHSHNLFYSLTFASQTADRTKKNEVEFIYHAVSYQPPTHPTNIDAGLDMWAKFDDLQVTPQSINKISLSSSIYRAEKITDRLIKAIAGSNFSALNSEYGWRQDNTTGSCPPWQLHSLKLKTLRLLRGKMCQLVLTVQTRDQDDDKTIQPTVARLYNHAS